MTMISNGDRTLTTSEKCRYCPAAIKCPALSKNFFRALEVIHEFTEDNLTLEEISFQLDLIARAHDVMKVKSDSLQALALDHIRNGRLIPNYTMESKLGDRKWKSVVSPEVIKELTGKDILKPTMLSPAQAEKIGVPKKLIEKLVDRFDMGPKLKKTDTSKLGEKYFGKGS